jgi:hypothetical protein
MDIEVEVKALRDEGYIEGELFVNPLWYIIWEPENIAEYNKDYELDKYAPGFTAFGSNGGNELSVVDEKGAVYTIPAIGMDPKYADKISKSISEIRKFMERNT